MSKHNKDIVPSAKDLTEAGPSSGQNLDQNVNPDQNNQDEVDMLDLERIQELETHTMMHEFVYQAPIGDFFLKALLPLVNLVHFCLVFDYAFDWLREHDKKVKDLCTSFDFMAIYDKIPSFNTIQQIMKRFKPTQIKFGHKTRADFFSVNILKALNASKNCLDTLFIIIRNPIQIINMYEISVNNLTIQCDPFFPNLGANPFIAVLRSINKNVKSITLERCSIDGFVTERFRDFDLEQLSLLNCETYHLRTPNTFFRQLTSFTKLNTLRIRCLRSYFSANLNTLNHVLFNHLHRLQQLKDLEITIGPSPTSIEPALRKLKRLRINIELRSTEFAIPEIMRTIQHNLQLLKHIEIHLFSMTSSLRTAISRVSVERLIENMHISNVKITQGFPFEDDDD